MSPRIARRTAWSLWVVGVAAILAASALATKYPFVSAQETSDPFAELIWSLSWVGFGLVGSLIVSQRPFNRIGWVLVGITFTLGLTILAPSYARAAFLNPESGLPLAGPATWLGTWTFFPATGLVIALLLLFPSGVLAARRHRALAWALGVVVGLRALLGSVTPGPVEGDGPPFNPLGLASLEEPLRLVSDLVSFVLVGVALLVLLDFIHRFWRSRGRERQQFRWLAWAAGAFPLLFFGAIVVEEAFLTPDSFDPVTAVFFVCGNGLAVAVGIAVTRHGLYEINRVISRSVSYVLLTALLVAVYLGAVTVLTAATAPVTGDSPIAVAAATLLAAAAFGPARRRIQAVVDRRFNRARYDAVRTVDTYRGRLRDEVDITTLADDLLATVATSMQPSGAALWLRGQPGAAEKNFPAPVPVTVPERRRETKGTS